MSILTVLFLSMRTFLKFTLGLLAAGAGIQILNSCSVGIPKGATAVQNFEAEKYLGKWYEIARFDYRFEKNLNNCTAEYYLNPDRTIHVKNRGFNYVQNKWKESTGEAKFVKNCDEARLKVSFFKPIWAGYNVIDLIDYKYALVAGNSTKYLWILSREKSIPDEVKERFLAKANALGFPVQDLIWVEHNR